jgi:hypothetical protein
MSVLRKEKKSSFTVIDNAIFKDRTLSMKAMGLLCLMLSLPDNWDYSIAGLVALVSDGESAVRSTLKELETSGYFRREQVRDNGRIAKIEYIVSETKNCENLVVENLKQENLKQENRRQLNTKELNTNKSNTKDIYTEFEILWDLYPKKQGKDKARGYYERARKAGSTFEEVEAGIRAYLTHIEVTQTPMQYVKMGSTYFSQKAWMDVYDDRPASVNPFTELRMRGGVL